MFIFRYILILMIAGNTKIANQSIIKNLVPYHWTILFLAGPLFYIASGCDCLDF